VNARSPLTIGFQPIFGTESVKRTPEIARIAALPRREWSEEEGQKLADDMTRELKTPAGTMHLRPVQAISLYEMMEVGGLLGPQRVGAGKSLVTFLAGLVLEAKRPILFVPASLRDKTVSDYQALSEHWRLPTNLQILSYESLGLVQSANTLNYISPDLIIADETHLLKNKRAGRTRRVARYMHDHPTTKFVGLSGTIMKGSILDFVILLRWALKDHAPIPFTDEEALTWAEALDEKVNPLARRKPGALADLGGPVATLPEARKVFQARLLQTKGVVASSRMDGVTCSLVIRSRDYVLTPVTESYFKILRDKWETPCGEPFAEALEFRRHARELALGFHYTWIPREKISEWNSIVASAVSVIDGIPLGLSSAMLEFLKANRAPEYWLNIRREWASFVRETLSHSRKYDTMLQVANACDVGDLDDSALAAWRAVENDYQPRTRAVFHDTSALATSIEWMKENKGIVWVEHRAFGEVLARLADASFYEAGGLDASGRSIKDVSSGRAIVASVAACGQGFNLQAFSANLVTACPSGPSIVEQTIGRTHREGQQADEVTVEVLLGCAEQWEAFQYALEGARSAADLLGHDQKLLIGTVMFPVSLAGRRGPLWG